MFHVKHDFIRHMTPHQAIKKRWEKSSHPFVQIGTIITGNGNTFNPQINLHLQYILRNFVPKMCFALGAFHLYNNDSIKS